MKYFSVLCLQFGKYYTKTLLQMCVFYYKHLVRIMDVGFCHRMEMSCLLMSLTQEIPFKKRTSLVVIGRPLKREFYNLKSVEEEHLH